jgi:nucleoid-associated protein YgaU
MARTNRRKLAEGLTSYDLVKGARTMAVTSVGRAIFLSLALIAVCGAALVFGLSYVQRERSVESKAKVEAKAEVKAEATVEPRTEARTEAKPATTTTPTVSPPTPVARDDGAAALATAQAEANAVAATLAEPPRPPEADKSTPVFDVARIARTGDAVIAGRAAPGAIVELLRNGEPHDRAVADQSGQFVMSPPPLPAGNYELTLRSRQPDGKQVTSEQRVAVALDAAESSPSPVQSRAEAPSNVPETAVANRSVPDQAAGSSRALAPSDKGSRSAVVVSRGDSLWRISRTTYGTGERYPLLLKANRDKIRNPDLIYPGQTFVLPKQAR